MPWPRPGASGPFPGSGSREQLALVLLAGLDSVLPGWAPWAFGFSSPPVLPLLRRRFRLRCAGGETPACCFPDRGGALYWGGCLFLRRLPPAFP